jgi:opacity protein-like surface antigen
MKQFLLVMGCLTAFASCASNPHHAKYAVEKNAPKFANTRSYVEEPSVVRSAARAALDELNHESDPPATGSIKDGDVLRTGWVYGVSKNRYVEFKANGKPARKELRVRRKYGYGITPSLAGTDVSLQAEEETMQVDLKTGEEKGWKSVETDPAVYDLLARRLTDQLRQR